MLWKTDFYADTGRLFMLQKADFDADTGRHLCCEKQTLMQTQTNYVLRTADLMCTHTTFWGRTEANRFDGQRCPKQ